MILVKLFRQANGLAYWNPGSELNVSPVDCPAQPEVKRTSHPKRAMAPLQGARAKIEDAADGIQRKSSAAFATELIWNPAATYSPGPLPVKYHRH